MDYRARGQCDGDGRATSITWCCSPATVIFAHSSRQFSARECESRSISTISTRPPMVADELRRQADEFIDLAQLIPRHRARSGRAPCPVGKPSASALRRPRCSRPKSRCANRRRPGPGAMAFDVSPPRDCAACPRLAEFRAANRVAYPDWSQRPGQFLRRRERAAADRRPRAGPPRREPHRTPVHRRLRRRPALRDAARFGFASGVYDRRPDDGLELVDCAIVNAVRCVPPQNKPTPQEIANCRAYLAQSIAALSRLRIVLALGRIAHDSGRCALSGARAAAFPFAHGATTRAQSRTARPLRQLPLLALQHQHRRLDRGDVSRRFRRDPRRTRSPVEQAGRRPMARRGNGRTPWAHSLRPDRRRAGVRDRNRVQGGRERQNPDLGRGPARSRRTDRHGPQRVVLGLELDRGLCRPFAAFRRRARTVRQPHRQRPLRPRRRRAISSTASRARSTRCTAAPRASASGSGSSAPTTRHRFHCRSTRRTATPAFPAP